MSRQRQQQQLQQQPSAHGLGVVTESVAFKLVCDMQHLRGKVDLVCGLGAALAQRWVEEVVQHQHQSLETAAVQAQQQHKCHQQHRRAVESRLRSELEELVLELVDVSVEVQKMKERKEQVQRFFYLTERRSSWCQVYDSDSEDEDEDESVDNIEIEMKMNVETSKRSTKKGEAKAMLKMIDLDECDQVIDRLTTLLLGFLTAGEREEEERALRSKTAQQYPMSDVDIARRLPRPANTTSIMRLPGDQHDDNLLR